MHKCIVTWTNVTGQNVTVEFAVSDNAVEKLKQSPMTSLFDVCYTYRIERERDTVDRTKAVTVNVDQTVIAVFTLGDEV